MNMAYSLSNWSFCGFGEGSALFVGLTYSIEGLIYRHPLEKRHRSLPCCRFDRESRSATEDTSQKAGVIAGQKGAFDESVLTNDDREEMRKLVRGSFKEGGRIVAEAPCFRVPIHIANRGGLHPAKIVSCFHEGGARLTDFDER